MTDVEALIDAFFRAHTTEDDELRAELLESAITDDFEFHGLNIDLMGRDAVFEHFRGQNRLVRTTHVDRRGSWFRWGWEYQTPDGLAQADADGTPYAGMGIGQIAPDGRLKLVVPFLGSTF